MNYTEFISNKKHLLGEYGFTPKWMPDSAFDFQQHIISKAVRKGRYGIFADTGLGKTLIQLSIAKNIVQKTNRNVLILTPLAVAFQFIDEANRIGVELKDSYFKQAKINLEYAKQRFKEETVKQDSLFSEIA